MIHLFNVPFPKWNPCNPTKPGNLTVYISRTPHTQWNLIRAKTVYPCLDSDIYWKWPLVKVIANAWKGSAMKPWRLRPSCHSNRTWYVNRVIYQTGHPSSKQLPQTRQQSKCTHFLVAARLDIALRQRTNIHDYLCVQLEIVPYCVAWAQTISLLSLISAEIVLFLYCGVSPSIQQCVQIHHMIQWHCLCQRAEIRQLPLLDSCH